MYRVVGLLIACLALWAVPSVRGDINSSASQPLRIEAEDFSSSAVNQDVLKNGGPNAATGQIRRPWGDADAVTDWQMATELHWKIPQSLTAPYRAERVRLRYACGAAKPLRIAVMIGGRYAATAELKPTQGWSTYAVQEIDLPAALRPGQNMIIVNMGYETLVLDWCEFLPAAPADRIRVQGYSCTGLFGLVTRRLDFCGVPAITDWQETAEVTWKLDDLAGETKANSITFRYISADKNKPLRPTLAVLRNGMLIADITLEKTADWSHYREQTVRLPELITFAPDDELTCELRTGGAIVLHWFSLQQQ